MKNTLIEPTKYIKDLFDNTNNDIISILKFQKSLNLQSKHELLKELFHQRTAEQILKDGFVTGCTDDAIVFITLAKANGLDPIYVETLEKNWLETPMEEQKIIGHVFVRVDDVLIDPQRKVVYTDPEWALTRYVIYGEAKEPYDLGLTSFPVIVQKFMDFKEKYKTN